MQETSPGITKTRANTSTSIKEKQRLPVARENRKPSQSINLTTKQVILLLCTMLVLLIAGLIVGFASGIYYERSRYRMLDTTAVANDGEEGIMQSATVTREEGPTYQNLDTPLPTGTVTSVPSPEPTSTPTPAPLPPFFEGPIEYGRSVNDFPLYAYRFGYGESARIIIGGIHGGYEWNTIELVSDTLEYYQEHWEEIPSNITLYLIPNMNPDGYAADTSAEIGRMNGNLVDLNRNWDYQWQITATHGTRPVKAGTGPFSEPETAATRDFILNHKIELAIFYHSAMGVIFSGAEREKCATFELAEMLSQVTGYPHQTEGIYGQITTGDAIDYLSDIGIAAAEVELTTHSSIGESEWQRNLAGIRAFLNWTVPGEIFGEDEWKYVIYTIQVDDTLWGIAENYGMDTNSSRYKEFLRVNNVDENAIIRVGDVLTIPKSINIP
jgi:hypothetical protein